MKHLPDFLQTAHDPRDPNPWLALYLDDSTPLPDKVKMAWLKDSGSRSRQFLMPFVRPLARLAIVLIQIGKLFTPKGANAPRLLHHLLAWGLKRYVSAEANWLILRHFHLGSEVLAFIGKNAGVTIPSDPLKPPTIDALKDNLFLRHDLNLYNFIIDLNHSLRSEGRQLAPPKELDFSMLTECPVDLDSMPHGWTNQVDLQTAIEMFTPLYQLFLTDNDFWRAANSLQLDETVALYVAKLIGRPEYLVLLNNRHPLVPLSTMRAGFRLVLHGLSTEMLHALLLRMKRESLPRTDRHAAGPA